MSTTTVIFGTLTTITLTLTSLASDTNLVAGAASTAITQNGTDNAIDSLFGGKITLGAGTTNNRQVEVWLYASYDGTNYTGGASGTDGNLTPQEKTLFKLLQIIPTVSTNTTYAFGTFSVAQAFGGMIPSKWGVYVVHNTGVSLSSTASNHGFFYYPVKISTT